MVQAVLTSISFPWCLALFCSAFVFPASFPGSFPTRSPERDGGGGGGGGDGTSRKRTLGTRLEVPIFLSHAQREELWWRECVKSN